MKAHRLVLKLLICLPRVFGPKSFRLITLRLLRRQPFAAPLCHTCKNAILSAINASNDAWGDGYGG